MRPLKTLAAAALILMSTAPAFAEPRNHDGHQGERQTHQRERRNEHADQHSDQRWHSDDRNEHAQERHHGGMARGRNN